MDHKNCNRNFSVPIVWMNKYNNERSMQSVLFNWITGKSTRSIARTWVNVPSHQLVIFWRKMSSQLPVTFVLLPNTGNITFNVIKLYLNSHLPFPTSKKFRCCLLCFQIEASDVGPLLKVRVGHDGKGAFAGWFLDKVTFDFYLSLCNHKTMMRFVNICRRQLF
jgi:hypothetical protein